MVSVLAERSGIPMPRLYVVDSPVPNAFATGRDPAHSAIAVTTGILDQLDDRQLAGVLAHELSHVKNRDTLIGTIAATVGGAISFLAQMAQVQMFFGGGDDEGGNPLALMAAAILAPIAAMLIQLAVSRSREYLADTSGVALTGDPEGLARALETIDASAREHGLLARFGRRRAASPSGRPAGQPALNPAFAHLYIVNPIAGLDVGSLFLTHPPIPERVARLRRMRVVRAD
jgi:heat shock protein HtpX